MISRYQQVIWSSNSSPVLELMSKPSIYHLFSTYFTDTFCANNLIFFLEERKNSNLPPWHRANWVINTTIFFYYYYMYTKQLFQDQFQTVNLCISGRDFLQVTTLREGGRTESLNHSNKWFVLKRLIHAPRVNGWFCFKLGLDLSLLAQQTCDNIVSKM